MRRALVSLRPPWARHYRREDFLPDVLAGAVVAILLVPQGMAYALLAGLPPQTGLYAGLLPPLVYALTGSSRVLAVGPVAMVSLLVASSLGELAPNDPTTAASLALTLALLVGVLQLAMGALRAGFLTDLLSHPVLSGFTSAAALAIAASQVPHLLGLDLTRTEAPYQQLVALARALPSAQLVPALVGTASLGALLLLRRIAIGPLLTIAGATLVTAGLALDAEHGLAVVGAVPRGLPELGFAVPRWDSVRALLPAALAITLVASVESIGVAKALAARRREKIAPDRELVALGLANLAAAASAGYPVTGGFSRSVVNDRSGARSGVSSLVTAALVAAVLLFLTPLFVHLPKAALAAMIVVAVAGLIDWKGAVRVWRGSRAEGLALAATFVAVLALGIEAGVLIGAGLALTRHLVQTSRPHVAVLGRVGASEHFRNVRRHPVTTDPRVLLLRVDESLSFLNIRRLEERILSAATDRRELEHLVLVCSGVNEIDVSASERLEAIRGELIAMGIGFHLAEVKGPVEDRLRAVGFFEAPRAERPFLSTHEAARALDTHAATEPEPDAENSQQDREPSSGACLPESDAHHPAVPSIP